MAGSARVVWLLLALNTAAAMEGDSCVTPHQRMGSCVQLDTCRPLMMLLEGPRPLDPRAVDFLRRSQCGFVSRMPLVCCAQPTTPSTTTPGQTAPLTDPLVDVTGDVKLRLLPLDICSPPAQNRIIGGNKTALFEYPWMALLAYDTWRGIQFRCGGTVINKRYILTAAHCITNLPPSQKLVGVRLGEHDMSKELDCVDDLEGQICAPPYQNFTIEEVIPHPQFSKSKLQNDIGLIRLSRDADFSTDSVKPICLPIGEPQRETLEGKKLIITGWGATETGLASDVLLWTTVAVVPLDKCAAIYQRAVPISEAQICAGGAARDSCGGDSGGPLMYVGDVDGEVRRMQFGVVSFGPKRCGTAGQPGVYTRVGAYMDWILASMRP
ncbi:CLIP domain-containing serine protease B4-like [Bacillus rossius redtenbacheri]|uniref:CLIP domain-containing serine protease B4-like n=1 Tax=Bacillus rossius redtenbacheri TaxID=93214 RepID=UPI002FDD79EC